MTIGKFGNNRRAGAGSAPRCCMGGSCGSWCTEPTTNVQCEGAQTTVTPPPKRQPRAWMSALQPDTTSMSDKRRAHITTPSPICNAFPDGVRRNCGCWGNICSYPTKVQNREAMSEWFDRKLNIPKVDLTDKLVKGPGGALGASLNCGSADKPFPVFTRTEKPCASDSWEYLDITEKRIRSLSNKELIAELYRRHHEE